MLAVQALCGFGVVHRWLSDRASSLSCCHLHTVHPDLLAVNMGAAAVLMNELLALLSGWLGVKHLDFTLQLLGMQDDFKLTLGTVNTAAPQIEMHQLPCTAQHRTACHSAPFCMVHMIQKYLDLLQLNMLSCDKHLRPLK